MVLASEAIPVFLWEMFTSEVPLLIFLIIKCCYVFVLSGFHCDCVCHNTNMSPIIPVLAKYENQINAFSDFLEDLPEVDEPVWILGACYDLKTSKTDHTSTM